MLPSVEEVAESMTATLTQMVNLFLLTLSVPFIIYSVGVVLIVLGMKKSKKPVFVTGVVFSLLALTLLAALILYIIYLVHEWRYV